MRNLEGAGISLVSIIIFIVVMAMLGRMASQYTFKPSTSDDSYANGGNYMVTMQTRI